MAQAPAEGRPEGHAPDASERRRRHRIKRAWRGVKADEGFGTRRLCAGIGRLRAVATQEADLRGTTWCGNACDAITLLRAQKVDMHPIAGENVRIFQDTVKGDLYEALYYVTMFTRLREGEVPGLTWGCFDFGKSAMKVYRQLQREQTRNGGYRFDPLKNSKDRSFMIPDNVKAEPLNVKREQAEKQLQYGGGREYTEGFVFTNESGRFLM